MNVSKTVEARKIVEQIASKKVEQIANKTIEQIAMKKIKAVTEKYFIPCLDNLLVESRKMTTPLGKSITRNWIIGTEQPAQMLLQTTEIVGSVSIANPLRYDTVIQTDPNIQPTIVHFKQATIPGGSDWNHLPIGSFNIGIYVPISGRNIDNRTKMNPQGPIVTTIL